MNQVRVSSVNGLADGKSSSETTLKELLEDDSLTSSCVVNEADARYHDCLTTFIAGDPEGCIQKMYEYELLLNYSLMSDWKLFSLFQEACYAVGSFSRLGFRLKDVIRRTFTGDPRVLNTGLANDSLSSEICLLNKYYRCSAFALLMDESSSKDKAISLEDHVRRTIGKVCPRISGQREATEFELLIETFIFLVQTRVLKKSPSASLYKKLCERVPELSAKLQQWSSTHGEETIENHILSQLQLKHSKTKKHRQRSQSSSTVNTGKPNPPAIKPTAQVSPKQNKLQNLSKWQSLLRNYISKVSFKRQNLLFLLILLLISLKSARKLSKLSIFFTRISSTVLVQLKALLKLLSSM